MQQRGFLDNENQFITHFSSYYGYALLHITMHYYYFCTVDKFNFQVRSSSVVGSVVKNFCEKLANYIISTVSTTLEHQSIMTVY